MIAKQKSKRKTYEMYKHLTISFNYYTADLHPFHHKNFQAEKNETAEQTIRSKGRFRLL